MTCPSQDAVLRHALVGLQYYHMPWSGHSFKTCLDVVRIQFCGHINRPTVANVVNMINTNGKAHL